MIKKVKIEEFQIYGPSVRTNNALEMSASGKISNYIFQHSDGF